MKELYSYPNISIAIVNLNGKDYLRDCLASIKGLDYPVSSLEIIVVDNGSTDGSAGYLKKEHPDVRVIENTANLGFAKANNQAAQAATGEYIAFLNNDTKVDKGWLIELLKPIHNDSEIICSGSKVLSFDGKKIDFAGAMINFEGKGFQIDYGVDREKDTHHVVKFLPFVNGGAMLIQRDIFLRAGGFDEDFFAYYEDVDLGWRLWVLGYKVVFVPTSIVYHAHHGTSKNFGDDKLRFLRERNALYAIFKNYDDDHMPYILAATLASIFNRIFVDTHFDYKKYYDLNLDNIGGELAKIDIDSQPLSSLFSVKDFLDSLPALMEKREKIQKFRRRDDKALFNLFKGQFLSVSGDQQYQQTQINLLKSLGIYKVFEKKIKRTLVIVSNEVVTQDMAGPAIRVWNFAKVLSAHMHVILAIPNKNELDEQEFDIKSFKDDKSLKEIIEHADIILSGGTTFYRYRCIKESQKYLVMDMYDPYNLATLAEYSGKPFQERLDVHQSIHFNLNEELYNGDFFLCASERQRDFWLGMLSALNRVNPFTYHEDPSLRKLIDIVPFGLPSHEPMHDKKVLKGVVDGIGQDDFLILWGGGIYNWFDPITLVKAMDLVRAEREDIKLYFMGIKHPNPEVRELSMVNDTVNLAGKMGLTDKTVFFNFGWVPYHERHNYLLESDAGIITHPQHIETRFSFRTRILDYIWTGLPIISTRGDSLSGLIEKEQMGITVVEDDPVALAHAIIRMASDKSFHAKCADNVKRIKPRFYWEEVTKPLLDYCKDPIVSAMKKDLSSAREGQVLNAPPHARSKNATARFFYHLKNSGPKKTLQYMSNYLKHQ